MENIFAPIAGPQKLMRLYKIGIWGVLILALVVSSVALYSDHARIAQLALDNTIIRFSLMLVATFIIAWLYPKSSVSNYIHILTLTYGCLALGIILSYLAAMRGSPLIDNELSNYDHFLGFDWLAFYNWAKPQDTLRNIMVFAYDSFLIQKFLLDAILNWYGKCEQSWEFLALCIVTCLVCIVFSAIWPAVGTFGFYHVELTTPYVVEFHKYHDGISKVIGETAVQGFISFPSFHAALAVIFIYIARGLKELFVVISLLNVVMLLSVPLMGGHYLVDVLAGAALAGGVILLNRFIKAHLNRV